MRTEIDFLQTLELDLLEASERGIAPVETIGARAPRRRRVSRRLLVGAVAMVVAVAGVVGYVVGSRGLERTATRAEAAPRGPSGSAGTAPHFGSIQRPERNSLTRYETDSLAPGQPVPAPVPGQHAHNRPSDRGGLLIGPQIVKTGELEVEVPKGQFDEAFRAATLVARRYRGFIESSSIGGRIPESGRLIVRIPAARFEEAVAELRGLGQVLRESIEGEDVTAEYVDLQSRIRTWEAQEIVLLRLMAQASSIQETLTVQKQVQSVQFQIERLKGQLRVLRSQTAKGTISLSLHEPLPPDQEAKNQQQASAFPAFGEAWRDAVGGLLGVVYAVLIGLGYLLPVIVVGLGMWWFVARRRRLRDVA